MTCCIPECATKFKNEIHSFVFPTDSSIRERWITASKVKNPEKNDRICSKHFLPSDYCTELELNSFKPSLKKYVIPSQNLPSNLTDQAVYSNLKVNDDLRIDYQLNFDADIEDEERRFYLKLYPNVDLVLENKTHCTSCNVHLGTSPENEDNIKMHPILKVTQCKKCHDFYNSGEFSKGEDGSELYCRWCGQGGEVYCCAKCPYVFCKTCISENLAESLVNDIRENENWNCFVCSPKITWPVRAVHWALKNYIDKQKQLILMNKSNEIESKSLMIEDKSKCCSLKPVVVNSPNSIITTQNLTPKSGKKRKRSIEDSNDKSNPKILNKYANTGNAPTLPMIKSIVLKKKPKPIILTPTLVLQNQASPAVVRPVIQGQTNQTQVKIVQIANQKNKTNNSAFNMKPYPQQQINIPPSLVIPNRAVNIRPHLVNSSVNLINQVRPNRPIAVTESSSILKNNNKVVEQTPVYHTIGGFCIDLNSAAQHESIRLPNGKLIQVKKSSNNVTQNNNSMNVAIPQHFTITQPLNHHPLQQQQLQHQQHNVQPAPNSSGTFQLINGNVIQQIQNQSHLSNLQIRPIVPALTKHVFLKNAVGKARTQLQSQIFTAMEICNHLSGKIQTLTNSNPYKNAKSHIDVKELYIHLSYLFTYAIGRFKNLQDKCNEDMTNMGFNTDVSQLCKGQLAAEKYASDGDEDEIEIVEPKTTTIDLDSDTEQTTCKNKTKSKLINKSSSSQTTFTNDQTKKQNWSNDDKNIEQIKSTIPNQQQLNLTDINEDYHLPLSLLAGMLEVELTEGNNSLSSKAPTKSSSKNSIKKSRKKSTSNVIKQKASHLRALYEKMKRNDLKLKKNCLIIINPLDLSESKVNSAVKRYFNQPDQIKSSEDVNDAISSDLFDNMDENVEVMQLLEVTMSGSDGERTFEDDESRLKKLKNVETPDKNVIDDEHFSLTKKIDSISDNMEENVEVIQLVEGTTTDNDGEEGMLKEIENAGTNEEDKIVKEDVSLRKKIDALEKMETKVENPDEEHKHKNKKLYEIESLQKLAQGVIETNANNDNKEKSTLSSEKGRFIENLLTIENESQEFDESLKDKNQESLHEEDEETFICDDEENRNDKDEESLKDEGEENKNDDDVEDISIKKISSTTENNENASKIFNVNEEVHCEMEKELINNDEIGESKTLDLQATDNNEKVILKNNKINELPTAENITTDVETNMLTLENSCDLIDELLADAIESKSSEGVECSTTDYIAEHLNTDFMNASEHEEF